MKPMITLTLDFIENALKDIDLKNAPVGSGATDIADDLNNPFLKTAAVLVSYDPDRIQPISFQAETTNRKELINQLIGHSELILVTGTKSTSDSKDEISYKIKDEVRKKVLDELIRTKEIDQAIRSGNASQADAGSRLQELFIRVLQRRSDSYEALDLEGLNALLKISGWVNGTSLAFKDVAAIQTKIIVTELLDTFRHLTGRYENGSFNEYFRGRTDELSTLRQYAGVADTQGALETIKRFIEEYIEPVFDWQSKPPLSIYGIGGTGKSTLLAKFLLDHAEAHQQHRFPFVYLDFDRPILDALQPESLLVEAGRQLHIQYYDQTIAQSFLEFYNRWKDRRTQASAGSDTEFISISGVTTQTTIRDNRLQIIGEFSRLMQNFKSFATKPFLMVIDTFEEVQYRGQECVGDLFNYLSELQRLYPLLRVVISGRARIQEIKTQEMEIKELDPEAAAGYLNRYGIRDKRTVNNMIKTVGGNPLSLKLAIELVRNFGEKELSDVKVTKKSLYIFRTRFPDMEVQGILYKRLLGHIKNKQVKQLAHPGLVLRRLNAELIYYVLNEPCTLQLHNSAEANALFHELTREVSLISYIDQQTVRHRPDIRKVMLSLILKDKPKLVSEIHRMAILFYHGFNDSVSRAEEIYHRLALDQPHPDIDERWIPGVGQFLGNAMDEIPPRAQAYLAGRLDVPVEEPYIWDEAHYKVSERRMVKRAVNLLNSGHGDKVLNMFTSISDHINKSGIMTLIKANAELQLKDTAAARNTIESARVQLDFSRLEERIKNEMQLILDKLELGEYDQVSDSQTDYPDASRSHDEDNDEGNFNFEVK